MFFFTTDAPSYWLFLQRTNASRVTPHDGYLRRVRNLCAGSMFFLYRLFRGPVFVSFLSVGGGAGSFHPLLSPYRDSNSVEGR